MKWLFFYPFEVNDDDFLDNKTADLNVEPTTGNYYYPTIFFNEFWLLRDKLIPLNDTVTALPLNLELGPISMTKWQLFLQIDQSFQIHRSYGSMLEGEADQLKVLLIVVLCIMSSEKGTQFLASSFNYFIFFPPALNYFLLMWEIRFS